MWLAALAADTTPGGQCHHSNRFSPASANLCPKPAKNNSNDKSRKVAGEPGRTARKRSKGITIIAPQQGIRICKTAGLLLRNIAKFTIISEQTFASCQQICDSCSPCHPVAPARINRFAGGCDCAKKEKSQD
ncbi:MAG: hypothetical protein HQM06_03980 [Magnetococcales bacterium]|nr:hypothetical protein [Magnetococcales bacterium]